MINCPHTMRLTRKLVAVFVLGMLLFMIGFDVRDIRNDWIADEAQLDIMLRETAIGFGASLEEVERVGGPDAAARVLVRRNKTGHSWLRRLPPASLNVLLSPPERELLQRHGDVRIIRGPEHSLARMFVYRSLAGGDYIEVSQSLARIHAQIHAGVTDIIWKSLLLLGLAAVCMLVLGGWFVARPVQTLIGFARRVGEGDLSQRVALGGHDELSELGTALNAMCERLAEARTQVAAQTAERLAAVEQLRHADRLKTVGQLAAGIAHELGTPLNVVSGHAKMIVTGESSPAEVTESAGVIIEQTAHITAVIRQLMDFARSNKPALAAVDVAGLSRHTVKLLAHMAAERKVRLLIDDEIESIFARIDEGQIRQALTNLIVNALQAVQPTKSVVIGVRRLVAARPGGSEPINWACISVKDEGSGIPQDHLPHIFDPFFTTKAVGDGSGLGLSVARGIVEEHGGFIDVESTPIAGSCFSIFLPAADKGQNS